MEKAQTKRITVFLTDPETEMLRHLIRADGYTTLPEAIHASVRGYYQKRFPVYVRKDLKKQELESMSPELKCQELGGIIDEKNQTCKVKVGALTEVTPLHLL